MNTHNCFCISLQVFFPVITYKVFQRPPELLKPLDHKVKLTFTYKIPKYNTGLWYPCSKGDTALKPINYTHYNSGHVEPSFTGHFNVSGNGENTAYLHILRVKHPEHSTEYFSNEKSFSVLQKPK